MKNSHPKVGTVIIELIFVTAFMGIGVLALYSALIFGQNVGVRANHLTRASQIASQAMENIRQTAYANLATPYNGNFIGITDAVTELPSGANNLTTSYYDSPTNTIKKVVATVTWQEKGKTESVQYTTLVVAGGIGQ